MRSWLRSTRARTVSPRLRFESLEQRLALTGAPTVSGFQVSSTAWDAGFVGYLHSQGLGDGGCRVPVGSSGQMASLPWTNIDKLIFKFSEDVQVLSGHLSLTGVGVAHVDVAEFEYDPQSFTATWTLSTALPKNGYRVELDGDGILPIRDIFNNALDGEWTTSSSVYPSGNGVNGGDFAFEFRVLPGDADQNGVVNSLDHSAATALSGFTTASSGYAPLADVDGSGSISSTDADLISARLNQSHVIGSPVGASDDAPSSKGWRSTTVNKNAVDAVFDLWDDFADAETADSAITYQITSTSNASIWSNQSINAVTGKLHMVPALNATGLSAITVTATDSSGQTAYMKYIVDLGGVNQDPTVYFDSELSVVNGRLTVSGWVADDGEVEGLYVCFSGVIVCQAYVKAGGTFRFVIDLPEEDPDCWATAVVFDPFGAQSLEYEGWVGA
ncbi:dockerin type I domain-containing protein [Lacipirellula sp.]|uniref:dockerin type I domain-containing protein n=1 Tax=Lacipirellula sp. TaxID=2691419 RepID=UPI003D09F387